jgi:hypothetical protein
MKFFKLFINTSEHKEAQEILAFPHFNIITD